MLRQPTTIARYRRVFLRVILLVAAVTGCSGDTSPGRVIVLGLDGVDPQIVAPNLKNVKYLSTKRDKLGHLFGELKEEVRDNDGKSCGCKCESTAKGEKDGC